MFYWFFTDGMGECLGSNPSAAVTILDSNRKLLSYLVMSKLPPIPTLRRAMPPLPDLPTIKLEKNAITLPHIGKIEFESTNRDFSLEEDETEKIIRKTLKPLHATDPNILRFIDNYLHCRDAKQAARLSGLVARDGTNLINRKDIHDCIQKITAKGVRKFGFDAEEIVERVKEVAFVDPALVQNEDGSFISKLRDMEPDVRRAIKRMKVKNLWDEDPNGMKVITGEIIEIEFWDKMKAVEMLGREKGTFKQTTVVEHGVSKNMRKLLLDTTKRADARLIEMKDVTPEGGE